MTSPGSLNHLLGFHSSPRPRVVESSNRGRRQGAAPARKVSFLANSSSLRHIHMTDATHSGDGGGGGGGVPAWDDVLYLTMFAQDDDVCAVCLETHNAPVALTCGHMFCAVCIKSHAVLTEGARCPCCYDGKAMEAGPRPVKLEKVEKVRGC